jgi:hypothetical protein
MGRPRPEKKSERTAPPAASKILPMELRVGDHLTDETGEWEVIGRPYTTAGGRTARVRVQRVGKPYDHHLRTWSAHERISVKRASAEEGKR